MEHVANYGTLQNPVTSSLLCDRCSEYVFSNHDMLPSLGSGHAHWQDKGKKFRARKETAEGDEYYRIEMFRSTWLIAAPSPLLVNLRLMAEMPDMFLLRSPCGRTRRAAIAFANKGLHRISTIGQTQSTRRAERNRCQAPRTRTTTSQTAI